MGKLKVISLNQAMEKCGFVASQKWHQRRRPNDSSVVKEKVLPFYGVAEFEFRKGALFHSIKLSRHRVLNAVRCPNQGLHWTRSLCSRSSEPGRYRDTRSRVSTTKQQQEV
jgi:hypothetical protein